MRRGQNTLKVSLNFELCELLTWFRFHANNKNKPIL